VSFDPDVLRRRDVRILVDGNTAAEMPYPTSATPLQLCVFELDGYELTAISWLPASASPDGAPLRHDLIRMGQSLIDGVSIDVVRSMAPAPGKPYPQSFQTIDVALRVVPGASGTGLFLGVSRNVETLGWPATIALLSLLVGATWLSTWAALRVWERVKSDERRSTRSRATRGCLAASATYAVGFLVVLVIAVALATAMRRA